MIINKKVILPDLIFLGWYHALSKTVYFFEPERGDTEIKVHSFFITFLCHAINVWSVSRYVSNSYFDVRLTLSLSLLLGAIIFAVGYLLYFRQGRLNRILTLDLGTTAVIFTIIASVLYFAGSFWAMTEVTNFLRVQKVSN